LRILAIGDHYIPATIFREALIELSRSHDINVIDLDESKKWKSQEEPISEYLGSPEQLVEVVGNYEALLIHNAPVTRNVIEKGGSLKIIGCARGWPVNVDVGAATERRIPVIYAPGRNSISVAELTMGFILLLSRNIMNSCWRVKARKLIDNIQVYEGIEVYGKTLGLIGLGSIGREVAKRAVAFGMKVIAYDPYVDKKQADSIGVVLMDDIKNVVKNADFLSIHARLTDETKGMINKELIDLMKPGSYFINTARAELVDQEALCEALKKGKVKAAALDVLNIFGDCPIEPVEFCRIYTNKLIPENFITNLDNCVVTPHIGGATNEAKIRSVNIVVEELKKFIEGKKLHNIANPSIFTPVIA
jgi:D-3-phosphoglycerate dehydrogenase